MKKRIIILSFVLLGFTMTNAQTVAKGNLIFNLGIGIGETYYASGLGYSMTFPPLMASGEYIIKDGLIHGKAAIGVGVCIGYGGYKYEYSDPYYGINFTDKYSNIFIGPRGIFHYSFVDKLDTYGGVFIGYDIVNVNETGTQGFYNYATNGSTLSWETFVGARYFFTKQFAGMAEIGYGVTFLNIGVAFKL